MSLKSSINVGVSDQPDLGDIIEGFFPELFGP